MRKVLFVALLFFPSTLIAEEVISEGLTLKIPSPGQTNWSQLFKDDFAAPISRHQHTGGGDGLQIVTGSIADNAVTGAKIRLANNVGLRSRNADNSGDIELIKLNENDEAEFGGDVIFTGLAEFDDINITGGVITSLDSPLSLTEGGTGATSASDARDNLELGTLALQDSNAISVSGGTISGTTITTSSFSGTGSGITALNASNLASGTIPSARVSGSYTGITGTGALSAGSISSGFGNINIGSSTFTGNGSGLTALNASNLSSGTLASARLSGTYSGSVSFTNINTRIRTSSGDFLLGAGGSDYVRIDTDGSVRPIVNNSGKLGTSSAYWNESHINQAHFGSIRALGSNASLSLFSTSAGLYGITLSSSGASTLPASGMLYLGDGSTRWDTIFLTNSPNVSSDARLKKEISLISGAEGLSSIVKLEPVRYKMKADKKGVSQVGFIAQQAAGVVPEAVYLGESSGDMAAMSYERVVPYLVAAVQELESKIKALEEELAKSK